MNLRRCVMDRREQRRYLVSSMTGAHHAAGGGFRNPWPDREPHGWRDVLRVVYEFWLRSRPTSWRAVTPSVATPAIAYPRASDGNVAATWIGHSTALLQFGSLNVLTDPVFSQRAFPVQWLGPRRRIDAAISLDALPPLDVVLISHNHYDHLDEPAVRQLARAHPQTTWVVPLRLGDCIRRWGVRDVIELDWWDEAVIGALRVTATPARHTSARGIRDRDQTLWCGFAIESAGVRAFFAGDTAYHPEFTEIGARCGPFDLAMIPIGAYDPRWFMNVIHVNPEEAVRIYQDLAGPYPDVPPPLMLGIHWGTFRLTTEPMDEPPRRTAARWRELGLDENRLWIASVGETRRVAVTADRVLSA